MRNRASALQKDELERVLWDHDQTKFHGLLPIDCWRYVEILDRRPYKNIVIRPVKYRSTFIINGLDSLHYASADGSPGRRTSLLS